MFGKTVNNLPTFGLYDAVCKNHYMQLDGKTYTNMTFDCDDYIVPPATNEDPKQKHVLLGRVFRLELVA